MKDRIILSEFDATILDNSIITYEYQLSDNTQYVTENLHITNLRRALDSLPGIETISGTDYNGVKPISIGFKAKPEFGGLFFITRCSDRRYWKYGSTWKIELDVGDLYENNYLPIFYTLHSGESTGENAYDECDALVRNLNNHVNHVNFMKGYDIDITKFTTIKKLKINS